MILPTKRISADRALLSLGAEVLQLLESHDKTVTQVWTEFQRGRQMRQRAAIVPYDWFVLALDLLFAINAIAWEEGALRRTGGKAPNRGSAK